MGETTTDSGAKGGWWQNPAWFLGLAGLVTSIFTAGNVLQSSAQKKDELALQAQKQKDDLALQARKQNDDRSMAILDRTKDPTDRARALRFLLATLEAGEVKTWVLSEKAGVEAEEATYKKQQQMREMAAAMSQRRFADAVRVVAQLSKADKKPAEWNFGGVVWTTHVARAPCLDMEVAEYRTCEEGAIACMKMDESGSMLGLRQYCVFKTPLRPYVPPSPSAPAAAAAP